jgi:hypothetical protein
MKQTSLALLLLVAPLVARATTIVAVPEAQLVEQAETIAVIGIIQTETVVDARGRVTTRARAQVYQSVRGAAVGDVLTVQVPGGRIAGMIAHTPGSPRLVPGRLYLGFFEASGGVRIPLGLSYGLLQVLGDPETGYRVTRSLDGLHLVTRTGAPVDPGTVKIDAVPLDTFLARIRRRVVELGGGQDGTVRP